MSWDARQRAMLEAMGLKVWMPLPNAPGEPASTPAVVTAGKAAPVSELALAERPAQAPLQRAPAPEPGGGGTGRPAAPPRAVQVPVPAPAAVEPPAASALQALLPAALGAAQGERAAAIQAMDWVQLRDSVASCRACGLCEGRQRTVFGVGHEQAHWMIIGEAPGEQEDLQGEPFVGQAGKLLDNMLRALGLTRGGAEAAQQVFIANTLKCRPPRNRNPEPAELAQCLPYLQRQIELVKPRIILALGRFAVQTLLQRSEAIGRLRGQIHDYQGIPVVVSYHPAYLLRNLPDKARAWEDLCLAHAVYRRQLGETGAG